MRHQALRWTVARRLRRRDTWGMTDASTISDAEVGQSPSLARADGRGRRPRCLRQHRRALPVQAHRPADLRRAARPVDHPGGPAGRAGRGGPQRARRGQPVPGPLVRAPRRQRPPRRARLCGAAAGDDRRRRPHRAGAWQSLPHDQGAQGAGRLRLLWPRGWSPASSTRPGTGRCGPPPATTPGAAWPSAGSWTAGAWPCCPRV